ncbi:Ribophorin I-domain-containing protein [Boletus reticuloceps]|uniref:Dolichyl-diphosphooligosaccharide--protein glycosyltransferase subunit 1 n=1 Tax=Boletus reticuloceps TaxID=495285 RepID=A0A8I3AB22_9AGAM|nr:Ribophorin I-domain-containing protein [Boletus reticuloceps]
MQWIQEKFAPAPKKASDRVVKHQDVTPAQDEIFQGVSKSDASAKEKEKQSRQVLTRPKQPAHEHKYSTANFKISHRKLNMLGRQISGKPIDHAIMQMKFSEKRASSRIKSMLATAKLHASVYKKMDPSKLIVSEAWVTKGPKQLKRLEPRGRGKFGIRVHPDSRLNVILRPATGLAKLTRRSEVQPPPKTMLRRWRTLSLLLLSSLLPSFALAGPAFENTAIVRTIELGGSLVHVSTTYAVKALEPGQTVYHVTFGKHEREKTSWIEAKVKGQVKPLEITDLGERDVRDVHIFAVSLPRKLAVNGTINLVLETIQTHATYPYPTYAAQADPQLLKYDTDLFVLSPYATLVQRTKIKSSSSEIPSYSTPEGIDEFVGDASVTKSGATITYGPYHNVASSTNAEFLFKHQQPISAQYNHGHPVLEVMKLQRSVEISHWGSNLNIEDSLISAMLALCLTNAYFYDMNGNVSTSHLRQTPSVPRGSKAIQHSIFEMRPRYPLLGGWNYSFTLGFDTPLQDSVSWDAANQRHIVGVPVMTHIPGSVVD